MPTSKATWAVLEDKDWVADDDEIIPFEDIATDYQWTHESYIAHGQIQLAFEDPDVLVSDIEADADSPIVYLTWVGDDE